MKKISLIAGLIVLSLLSTYAYALDTSGWYQYSGQSSIHTYTLKFPSDWKVKEISNDLVGFTPKEENEKIYSYVQEFEGVSYSQAINSILSPSGSALTLQQKYDIILSQGDDLLGKRAVYIDDSTKLIYEYSFFKWGSLILAVSAKAEEYDDILSEIHNSLEFDDGWHQYIDYSDAYGFIFPSNSSLETFDNGVRIMAQNQVDETIFGVIKYANMSVEDAAKYAAGTQADLKATEAVSFHGISGTIKATYEDDATGNIFTKIIVNNGVDSFAITNVNSVTNFPHPDYYDQYISESLESFEFFNSETVQVISPSPSSETGDYTYFKDVGENHPNQAAIDSLKSQGVIDGYPDGTFLPNGNINRAEITKLIVETVASPQASQYKNCFKDVTTQWFAPHVCYAQKQGWVQGYADGYFRPESSVNRVEAMKIVLEVLFKDKLKSVKIPKAASAAKDIVVNEWYSKYFFFAYNNDLLDMQHISTSGDGFLFHPSSNMSRKEVAEMIYRGLNF